MVALMREALAYSSAIADVAFSEPWLAMLPLSRAVHSTSALARCRERRTFGRPISGQQMIRAKLAEMVVRINAAALLTYQAAWSADSSCPGAGSDAAVAKLYASEAAAGVVDDAVQIFGGLGVTQGSTVERLYRHLRALRIFDGTSEIQKLIIAKSALEV